MPKKKKVKQGKQKLSQREKKNQIKKEKLPSPFKRMLAAAALLLGAVIISLSFFHLAGPAGDSLYWLLSRFGGRTVFLLPLFLVGLAVFFLSQKGIEKIWLIISGLALMESGFTGLLAVNRLYQEAGVSLDQAGGWLGQILAWPIFHFFGLWISFLLFIVLTIVGMVALSYPLYRRQKLLSEEKEVQEKKSLSRFPFSQPISGSKKTKLSPSVPKVNLPSFRVQQETQKSNASSKPKKGEYIFPPTKLLDSDHGKPKTGNIEKNSQIIEETLADFGVPIEMVEVSVGPTVTQYAFHPSEGIKLSRITTLTKNIALALAAHSIRMEAPIPGKSLVGIEVPNQNRMRIHLRSLLEDSCFKEKQAQLRFCLGRNVRGEASFADLEKMPHLLVAGATGAGKTVFLNNFITSLLYQCSPREMNFILIDPKRVEFGVYKDMPHLLAPVVVDFQEAILVLEWLIGEMERRFRKIAQFNVRGIQSFHRLASTRPELEPMPFIVLVIDELADLMSVKGREIEAAIVRLAQKSRAVGIHLVLATQRPSVEVITGLIKANISCRISFQVASQIDSRTILDGAGAERLLGEGDMLFLSPQGVKPIRIQAPFVSEQEILRVTNFLKEHSSPREASPLEQSLSESMEQARQGVFSVTTSQDSLYEQAKEVVLREDRASASLLQRRLAIGYARAARLLDSLEAEGVIGPPQGAKPRKIIFSPQKEENDEEQEEY